MRKKWLLVSAFGALAAVACAAFLVFRYTASQPAPVQAAKPGVENELILSARLQPKETVNVGVPVEGRIEAFHAEVGAEVNEGQLLAQVRSQANEGNEQAAATDYEAEQSKANTLETSIGSARLEASRADADAARVRADYERAVRNLQRQRLLLAEGATPKLVFEKALKDQATLEVESKNLDDVARQAESRVATLQKDLELLRKHLEAKGEELEQSKAQLAAGDIYSPVTGTVVARQGETGAEVNPSMRNLFQIGVDLSTMEAIAEPSPTQLAKVKRGQVVYISIAEAAEQIPGTVQRIEAGRVIIEFANPDTSLKPGLTAQVRIKLL